jgi:tetratricopeptide (TPR) repeat protein
VDYCLAILAHHAGPEADALRARCYIRDGRPHDALSFLSGIDVPALPHRAAAELLILKFASAIVAGDAEAADTALIEAKARSYGVGSVELESEFRYYCGLFAWTQGRYTEAHDELTALIEARSDVPTWLVDTTCAYTFNRGYWVARAYELLGMTAALKGDFASQSAHLLRAFEEYDRAACVDVRVEAAMLSNLAVLVRDLQTPELEAFVRERCERVAWNRALLDHRFLTLRALGWCHALGGDHLGGLRHFRGSADAAPSKALRITALLDRAFIAGELNERFFASEELELACRLASEVDWEHSAGSERMVLLDLARSLADVDVVQARRMLERYAAIRTGMSSLEVYANDRRRRGEECLARAAVARAEGQADRATMLFKEAFEIWNAIGYEWRAAATALEIFALTFDSAYLAVVAREAAARPHSWIARRYANVVPDVSPATARA